MSSGNSFELFPPLKVPLRSQFGNMEVPGAVACKLAYQWSTVGAMVGSDFALAHSMARSFVETAVEHGALLPSSVSERLCGRCSAPLVPSVTSYLRVHRRRSMRHNKAQPALPEGHMRPRSEVTVHCCVCGQVSRTAAVPRKAKPAPGPVALREPHAAAVHTTTPSGGGKASKIGGRGSATKFNFADMLKSGVPAKVDECLCVLSALYFLLSTLFRPHATLLHCPAPICTCNTYAPTF